LAGLTAQQQLEAIPAVKIFATVGETDLKASAETLVAVSTAYGYAAKDYGVVADIVAKTAASSMASVQDMSQAFRQASVVAQQYGVSLKDTALNLAMLAQIGIKGSAAGTSMRNMYTELMGSSERARKILKDVLRVDAWDNAAKSMRPIGELMRDMADALAKMDTEKQQEALNKLGSERGTKNMAANLMAMRTQYEGLGYTATNVFDKIVEDIDKAPGYAAQAAALMAGSTKNLMKSVSSSLEKSLISAFDETEPAVQRLAMLMKEAFGSKEFQEAVSGAAGSVASLITLLVEHADKLLWVAKAYISYQVGAVAAAAATLALGRAVAVGSAVMGLATALRSATLAMVAGGTASQALAAGMGLMGPTATGAALGVGVLRTALASLTTAAPWLIAISAALGAAYWAWNKLSDGGEKESKKVGKSMEDLVGSRKQLMDSINEEIERLDIAAGIKEENLSAEERQAKIESTLAKGRIDKIYNETDALLKLQENLRKTALVRIESMSQGELDEMGNLAPGAAAAAAKATAAARVVAEAQLSDIKAQRERLAEERLFDYMDVDTLTDKALAAHKRSEDERKKTRKATPSGTERPDMTFGRGGTSAASAAQTLRDNEIKELEKQYATNLKRVEDFTSSRKQILDAARSAEAISQATFAGRELDLTQSTEMEKLAVINSSGQLVLAAYDKAQKELGDQLSAAKKPQDREKLSQAMQNLLNSRDTFVNKL
ncbi:MAG: phage tail tape measure protein, partial [Armatimonadia bacterium]